MSQFYESVKERMIRYAKVDTESCFESPTSPSTEKQKDLGKMLAEELVAIGVENVYMSDECCVYGTIPATVDYPCVSLGFVAHMDTTPDITGANVKPWVLENYQGGDIIINKELGIVMEEATYPMLKNCIGKDLIMTDGTTLLGGDDKSAIVDIMTMAEYLVKHPEIPHGPIQIGFTPDEEIGRLAENFDLERFGADVAYTVDGEGVGGFSYQTFNAAEAQVTVHGLNVHPGQAKDIMINALEIGCEFVNMLPAQGRCQHTSGSEGYFHPFVFEGTVEKAYIRTLIRDHSMEKYEERKAYVEKCVAELNRRYGEGTVELKYDSIYYSMEEVVKKDAPYMTEVALSAIRACGVEPEVIAARGGTDGSALSQRGLPSPNITAGYYYGHSRFEFSPIQDMEKTVEILIEVVKRYADLKK